MCTPRPATDSAAPTPTSSPNKPTACWVTTSRPEPSARQALELHTEIGAPHPDASDQRIETPQRAVQHDPAAVTLAELLPQGT
jgi:hypothetical protein